MPHKGSYKKANTNRNARKPRRRKSRARRKR